MLLYRIWPAGRTCWNTFWKKTETITETVLKTLVYIELLLQTNVMFDFNLMNLIYDWFNVVSHLVMFIINLIRKHDLIEKSHRSVDLLNSLIFLFYFINIILNLIIIVFNTLFLFLFYNFIIFIFIFFITLLINI